MRVAVDADGDHVLLRHQLLGERARLVALDAHLVRMGVDERADLVHVAFGAQLPFVNEQDLRGHRLDLVQHVRRDHDAATLARQIGDDRQDAHARQRIAAGERLVEEHDLGIVRHRLGELGALPHALGVLAEPAVHRVLQVDDAEHLLGARLGVSRA